MKAEGCTATTQGGAPCNAQAWQEELCRWHHPSLAAERKEWSRKGGHERSNASRARKALPRDLRDTLDALYRVLQGVEDGTVEPARANAVATVARAIVAVQEVGELERRLGELESRAGLTDGRTA